MRKQIEIATIALLALLVYACGKKDAGSSFVPYAVQVSDSEVTGKKLSPELLWKFGRVSSARISPNGKLIVYTVRHYDLAANKGNTDLFLLDLQTNQTRQLTGFEGNETSPCWYPDGNKIGFVCDQGGEAQVWEIFPDGSNLKKLTQIKGGINSFQYSPKGDKILYTKDVKLEQTPQEKYSDLPKTNVMIIDSLMYRHWNSWADYAYSHVFVADYVANISDGKDIMPGEPFDSPMSPYFEENEITWSPNGNVIAYTCKKLSGKHYAESTNSDIYLFDLASGKTTNLTDGMPGYDRYPVFSPDGQKIAWQSMSTPGYESDKERLWVADLKTGEKSDLTARYDQGAREFAWNNDGDSIYFISGVQATYQVCAIDLKNRRLRQITSGIHDYTSLNFSANRLIGERMSMSQATEVFQVNIASGAETQLTFTNQPIYDKVKMGKVEPRWVTTTDKKSMLVWVIYPPDFDSTKTYPAILYCQGGPQDAVSQFFSYRWNFQLMASQGYIVIAPNRRGLPTFGQAWNDQIAGDYGGQNMLDYLSAVDALKTEPYIDANRIGAVGASYGGYSVYWLAGHHNKRFKAFIAHCGIFNLESQYGETEELFFINHDVGGPYWAKPKPASYNYSPHLFVDKWDTPILIITGANDFRISYTQSMQAFTAAQLRGIPSRMLFFPEESHFVLKPQNSVLWQREFFGWLNKWLK
jgi:dipeptidyl aminopeptidase/acylaminoacyl peptidase